MKNQSKKDQHKKWFKAKRRHIFVLHEYDKHTYPRGQNLKNEMTADQLSDQIKQRLFEDSSEENKDLVRKTMKLD